MRSEAIGWSRVLGGDGLVLPGLQRRVAHGDDLGPPQGDVRRPGVKRGGVMVLFLTTIDYIPIMVITLRLTLLPIHMIG